MSGDLPVLHVVGSCLDQLRVRWRWHSCDKPPDRGNVRLAAFEVGTGVKCAELVLISPDRAVTAAYGDEGDDGWFVAQDRSHDRFRCYEGACIDEIRTLGRH